MIERVTIDGKEWMVLSDSPRHRKLARIADGALSIGTQHDKPTGGHWWTESNNENLSTSETQALSRLLSDGPLKKIAAIYNKWNAHDDPSSWDLVEIGDVLHECGLKVEAPADG